MKLEVFDKIITQIQNQRNRSFAANRLGIDLMMYEEDYAEIIGLLFLDRNLTHLAHLKTQSYAEHKALGSFYDDVIDAVDSIVEAYQGSFGLIEVSELTNDVGEDIVKLLNSQAKWIEESREEISGGVRSIENLIDSLSDIYLRTIYKLENLS